MGSLLVRCCPVSRLPRARRLPRRLLLGAVLALVIGGAVWLSARPSVDAEEALGAGAQPGRQGGRTEIDSGAHKGPGW